MTKLYTMETVAQERIDAAIEREITRKQAETGMCDGARILASGDERSIFALVGDGDDAVQQYAFDRLADLGSEDDTIALTLLRKLAASKKVSVESQKVAARALLGSRNPAGLSIAAAFVAERPVGCECDPSVRDLVIDGLVENQSERAVQVLLYLAYEKHGASVKEFIDKLADHGRDESIGRIPVIVKNYGTAEDETFAIEKLEALAKEGRDKAVTALASLYDQEPYNNTDSHVQFVLGKRAQGLRRITALKQHFNTAESEKESALIQRLEEASNRLALQVADTVILLNLEATQKNCTAVQEQRKIVQTAEQAGLLTKEATRTFVKEAYEAWDKRIAFGHRKETLNNEHERLIAACSR